MSFIASIPVWVLALTIFSLRIVDVSIGTLRTLAIVQGSLKLAVSLGFFEVLIWISAVSQVMSRANEGWYVIIAYAAGFAVGNGVGMLIERKLAMGACAIRLLSKECGEVLEKAMLEHGFRATIFDGRGAEGFVSMIYVFCMRKELSKVLHAAIAVDPKVAYIIEPVKDWRKDIQAMPFMAGWRSISKKK